MTYHGRRGRAKMSGRLRSDPSQRYTPLERLGRGSFGEVFKAYVTLCWHELEYVPDAHGFENVIWNVQQHYQ